MSNINFLPPFSFETRSAVESTSGEKKSQRESKEVAKERIQLEMVAAGHSIPHIAKAEKEGEDAFFVSTARDGVIGLADGVSSWSKEGIDPSMYSKGLMKEVKRAIEFSSRLLYRIVG